MYNRILKRPMFKLGGNTSAQGTGITSGLDSPRIGLADGTGAIQEYINRLREKKRSFSGS